MISPNIQNNNQMAITQGYSSNIIPIHGGKEGARMYPVAAGYAALLLDEENKMFFIKISDASGIPRPLREFKYEEVTPADSGTFDPNKFATKEDFNTLLNEIKKLNTRDNGYYRNSKPRRNNNNDGSYEKSV